MRRDDTATVKKTFKEALRPEFIVLSTKASSKIERVVFKKVLSCSDTDLASALKEKYAATQKARRFSSGAATEDASYSLSALFSKSRTNVLNGMGKVVTDTWYKEAFDSIP